MRLYILICFAIIFTACEHESFVDEEVLAGLEETNAFVRIDNGFEPNVEVAEDGEPIEIPVEYIFPAETDIVVNYTLEGTAELGVDYNIEGASGTTGSITLTYDNTTTAITTGDIVIDLLTDGITDGDKTLTITLESASATEGIPLDVGQGDLYKSVMVNIIDVDCESDLAGEYNYTGTGFLDGAAGTVTITEGDGPNDYVISDFAGNAFESPTAYEFSVICGIVSAPAQSVVNPGVSAVITGTANEETKEIVLNVTLTCCGGDGLQWTLNLMPI